MILSSGGIPLAKLRSDEVARLNAEARSQNISLRDLIHQRLATPGAALVDAGGLPMDLDPAVEDWLKAVLLP